MTGVGSIDARALPRLLGRGKGPAISVRAGFRLAILILIAGAAASDSFANVHRYQYPFSCGRVGLIDLQGAARGLAVNRGFYGVDPRFADTFEFNEASGKARVAYFLGDAAEMARQIQLMEAVTADGKIGTSARQRHLSRFQLAYAWMTGEKAPLEKLKGLVSAGGLARARLPYFYDAGNQLVFPHSRPGDFVEARLAILEQDWERFDAAQERLARISRALREELSLVPAEEVPAPVEPDAPIEPGYASVELGRIELLRAQLLEMALAAGFEGDRQQTLKLYQEASLLLALDCVPELHAIAALGAIETRLAGIAGTSGAGGGPAALGARQLNEQLFTAWNLLAQIECHAMPMLYRQSRQRLDRILALASRIEVVVMKGLGPPKIWAAELLGWLPECSP